MDPLTRPRLADLVAAVERGDNEYVSTLLSLGVRPDVLDISSGWSALHASVLHDLSLLPMLLEHSVDPDGPQVLGGTALAYVVIELSQKPNADRRQQLLDAIGLFLQAGADPQCGGPDQKALELAHLYDMPDVKALLIKRSEGGRDATQVHVRGRPRAWVLAAQPER